MQALDGAAVYGMTETLLPLAERVAQQPDATVFDVVQDRTMRISWKTEVRAPMERIFSRARHSG